jgi:DNA-binding IclR family transcriptional regulator
MPKHELHFVARLRSIRNGIAAAQTMNMSSIWTTEERMPTDAIAGAQVVARTAQLLKLVSQRPGTGYLIAELVPKSGLTRPTVYRLLSALEATGLVEQDPASKRWHLGPEAYVLGTLAAGRFNIERLANDSLIRIADITSESAFLSIRRGGECVCLVREEGTYPIRTHVLQAGDRFPLGVGSAGLAILAALHDCEIDAIVAMNRAQCKLAFPNYSPRFIEQLVAQTRSAGYAVNRGLLLAGSWGIAAAIRDGAGVPFAALSITAVEARLPSARQRELGALLIEECERLQGLLKRNQSPHSNRAVA